MAALTADSRRGTAARKHVASPQCSLRTSRPAGTAAYSGPNNLGRETPLVQMFDIDTQGWVQRVSLPSARDQVASVLAPDGRIPRPVVASGTTIDLVDAYVSSIDQWSCATLATDGRIFVIGGRPQRMLPVATTELYGPTISAQPSTAARASPSSSARALRPTRRSRS